MHVQHLLLHDFRSYADVDVRLDPGVTAFIGRNGQGKTNLVEAIDYLSRLSSHRVASDAPLVRAGAERAVVRAAVVRDGRTLMRRIADSHPTQPRLVRGRVVDPVYQAVWQTLDSVAAELQLAIGGQRPRSPAPKSARKRPSRGSCGLRAGGSDPRFRLRRSRRLPYD